MPDDPRTTLSERYPTPGRFRAALEARLRDASRHTGLSLPRLQKLVVMDRLLARLLAVAPGRWIVKGGVAIEFRLGNRARTTKDLDLVRREGVADVDADFRAAQAMNLGDYFNFAIQRGQPQRAGDDDQGIHYTARADLAGREFNTIAVDVALADPLQWQPEMRRGRDLLAFAGIGPIAIPVAPVEQHLAEKVHAYTRNYGQTQAPSAREKDLVDIVLLRSEPVDAARLRTALERTFSARRTHELPDQLPRGPAAWGTAYRQMALEVGIPPNVAQGFTLAAEFLNPVLAAGGAIVLLGRWDPDQHIWHPLDG